MYIKLKLIINFKINNNYINTIVLKYKEKKRTRERKKKNI